MIGGKYRLERRVVAQDGVTIWDATDVHDGRSVRLSMCDHGSSVIDHGTVGDGVFIVTAAPPRFPARHLELVEISDEDAFFEELPPPPLEPIYVDEPKRSRAWMVAGALAVCAAIGAGAFHFARARAQTTTATNDAVTLTEAPLVAPTTNVPPAVPVEELPLAEPEHHDAPPPPVQPSMKRGTHAIAPAPKPPVTKAKDPLTL